MILNHSIEYALLGLVYLAKNSGRTVKISEIAEYENISVSFLQKVFQKLSKAGIVTATFGPRGGFRLKSAPAGVTLRQIVTAVEPARNNECAQAVAALKKYTDGKYIIGFLESLHKDYMDYLHSKTLAGLIK